MSILVKDANGVVRELQTVEAAGVHTPVNQVTGPLTDAQLRNSPVPVSSAGLTNAQLRASAVPVSGPVTDGQLRASPVPVSGPVTDAQLRASAVPVQLSSVSTVFTAPAPEISWVSGTFEVAEEALVPVSVPDGAIGCRIFARDGDVRYAVDETPALPSLNALGDGGIAKLGIWKDVRLQGGEVTLNLLSAEAAGSGSPGDPVSVDVEFYGALIGSES